MKAGPLRHEVTIQRPIGTKTASGAVRADFEDFLIDIAAAVEQISGSERWVSSQQISADITTRIRIRYRGSVNETMRVVHKLEPGSPTLVDIYDIEAALNPDGRKVEMHLHCIKRSAEGFRSGER